MSWEKLLLIISICYRVYVQSVAGKPRGRVTVAKQINCKHSINLARLSKIIYMT